MEPLTFKQVKDSHQLTRSLIGTTLKSCPTSIVGDSEKQLALIASKAFEHFNRGNLFFFDANIGNNQCHIGALITVRLYNRLVVNGAGASEESLPFPDAKFLLLSFMISNCFKHSIKPMLAAFEPQKFSRKMGNRMNQMIVRCKKTVQNRLDRIIRGRFIELLQRLPESALKKEIVFLAEKKIEEGNIFEFPKFPSLFPFLQVVEEEKTPVIIKVKLICPSGFHLQTRTFHHNGNPEGAVVIEAAGVLGSKTFIDTHLLRENCSKGFFFEGKRNEEHSCQSCRPCTDKECRTPEHLLGIEDLREFLLQDGVYFTRTLQREDHQEMVEMSVLNKLMQQYKKKKTVFIEHAFPDDAEAAKGSPRLLDRIPIELVQKREEKYAL